MPPRRLIEILESRIAPAFSAAFPLTDLNGENGFRIAGGRVNEAGDVNGDGFDDVIVGRNGPGVREALVYFGKAGGFVDFESLDGTNGFTIVNPGGYSSGFALTVSTAGDMNGDGFDDVIVGSDFEHSPGRQYSGSSYVIFGTDAAFPSSLDVSTLDGTNGFRIDGAAALANTGRVFGAGDVNGDGFSDVLITGPGAFRDGVNNTGIAYVVFGHGGSFAPVFDLAGIDGTNGFRVEPEVAGGFFGFGRASGDINGDGLSDVILNGSRPAPDGLSRQGSTYVIFGNADEFEAVVNVAELDGVTGFRVDDVGPAEAGDFNGDGFDDLIMSAPSLVPAGELSVGACQIVYGKAGGFAPAFAAADLDATAGFRIDGVLPRGYFASAVDSAGDVNGDHIDDMIIGFPNLFGQASGAYLVFGRAQGFAAGVDLASLDGTEGLRLDAPMGEHAGSTVSRAGDVNGDGFGDVMVEHRLGAGSLVFGGNIVSLPIIPEISEDGRVASFREADGDTVEITVSQGTLTAGMFTISYRGPFGGDLVKFDLTGHGDEFSGADLTIKATPFFVRDQFVDNTLLGDGRANVGEIDATGIDLATVKVDGDLTAFRAGAGTQPGSGVQSFRARSLGVAQDLFPTVVPGLEIAGRLGRCAVLGDVVDFSARVGVGLGKGIGALEIRGDLTGSTVGVGKSIRQLIVEGSILDSTILVPGVLQPADALAGLAIGSLRVQHDVRGSSILAGYDADANPVNGDVAIGPVIIQGEFSTSNLVAGIADSTGDGFGRNDTPILGRSDSFVSAIARLKIGGAASGSAELTDHFGITAEHFGRVKIAGLVLRSFFSFDFLLDPVHVDVRLVVL